MSKTASLAVGRGAAAPFVALVVGALAMAISPVFVRWADVGPFTSAFWRVTLALPALYVWMRIAERGTSNQRRFTLPVVLAGLAFAGDLLFWHSSILHTNVANATFFATTAPIWVVVFGWIFFRARVGRETLIGLALCLAGGAGLLAQSLRFRPEGAIGDAFGVVTGIFFGLYFLAVQAARRDAGAARVTFESSVITAAVLFVAAMTERHLLPSSLFGLGALLVISWLSHVGGQGLLAVALGRLPATFSSLVIFLEAVAAALFAFLLLGEPISLVQGMGGLLIMAGIYVARPRRV
ncbi:DMT family transporter [Rhodovastum atsumiense]|uniref:DMT family transporter n=1 Tax=Rhodovastum atsumiense TaxID=504468 RepID=A0A5M6ITS0_9PROT|nr:DMT family transporter [Rhodovastum atsumiense]KAA5610835.1 DMT family transporter [Rhodovastum atsumiense]CAH2602118.1 DMT family transporter [Rhodovastum atsumiense]